MNRTTATVRGAVVIGGLIGFASFGPGLLAGGAASAAPVSNVKIAFLMPDEGSTRYEEHDRPGFILEMKSLCPTCTVLYQNADADAARQQQQFNSVVSQGAKAIVIDPVDSTAAASLVHQAQSQGIKIIAYDRPIPQAPADYYVSFNNEQIGRVIAQSLVKHLKATGVPASGGLLEVNGSPTDAAAGLIKKGIHEGLGRQSGYTHARRVRHARLGRRRKRNSGSAARSRASIRRSSASLQLTTVRAVRRDRRIQGRRRIDPVPPVTGNDATIAGLQLIIAGDQYNTINETE